MGMIEHNPGVVMLPMVGEFAHVEPADAVRQHDDRGERAGRHGFRHTLSRDPLQPHQQRQLPAAPKRSASSHGAGNSASPSATSIARHGNRCRHRAGSSRCFGTRPAPCGTQENRRRPCRNRGPRGRSRQPRSRARPEPMTSPRHRNTVPTPGRESARGAAAPRSPRQGWHRNPAPSDHSLRHGSPGTSRRNGSAAMRLNEIGDRQFRLRQGHAQGFRSVRCFRPRFRANSAANSTRKRLISVDIF